MKFYKPTSKSRRHMSTVTYRGVLTESKPLKSLVFGGKRDVGRNNAGRITVNHKGGGNKRKFRVVDFKYDKFNIPAKIESVEYDPNRTSFISLACYADGERRYVVTPKSLGVGDSFMVAESAQVKVGNRLKLKNIPVGTFIYNIELHPSGGAKFVRSAGNYAEVLGNDLGYSLVKMPSSEVRKIDENCYASVGAVSNEEHGLVNIGKAGRSRWLGIRPTVRGTAKNPVDHPYGGGEGRQGRGTKRPKTRTGKITGGHKSRRATKYSNIFIVTRRTKKSRK
ncbi:MAG: 50S ribosomal protein L2 [Candidatus Vogelbacteria bacterium]|nr:50S ribosomal protein L2 [Candidatus Vogelbacteria bacterium]